MACSLKISSREKLAIYATMHSTVCCILFANFSIPRTGCFVLCRAITLQIDDKAQQPSFYAGHNEELYQPGIFRQQ